MPKVLINFAHPAQSKSNINMALRRAVEDMDNVTINDLYENYPDFLIDVKREQQLCESHDIIIFQHPFYWYSTPAIIKEWFDLVLEHGWAYGSTGKALAGKYCMQVISGGGDASTYQKDGFNEYTIAELTSPVRATAKLCNLTWIPPFTVLGVHRGLPEQTITNYANDYRRIITALSEGTLDINALGNNEFINSDVNAITNTAINAKAGDA